MRPSIRLLASSCCAIVLAAAAHSPSTASPGRASLSATGPFLVWSSEGFEDDMLVIGGIDGSPRRLLGRGRDPQISPDGRWVAYTDNKVENTYIVSSSGGRSWLVARGGRASRWASTSRHLLTVDHGFALYVTDVTTRRRVTIERGATILGASFSPSGNEIVWGRGPKDGNVRDGELDVFRAHIDGTHRMRLTRDGKSSFPVWGRGRIAFARVRSSGDPVYPIYELWTMQPSGVGPRRVTRTSHAPLEWSVDGRRLLTWSTSTSGVVVSVVDMDTGAVRPLIRGELVLPLALSKDGRSLLAWALSPARKPEGDLVRVDWSGRQRTLVRNAGQRAHWNL